MFSTTHDDIEEFLFREVSGRSADQSVDQASKSLATGERRRIRTLSKKKLARIANKKRRNNKAIERTNTLQRLLRQQNLRFQRKERTLTKRNDVMKFNLSALGMKLHNLISKLAREAKFTDSQAKALKQLKDQLATEKATTRAGLEMIDGLENNVKSKTAEIAQLKNKSSEHQGNMKDLENLLSAKFSRINTLESELDLKGRENHRQADELTSLKKQLAKTTTLLDQSLEENEKLKTRAIKAEESTKAVQQKLDKKENDFHQLKMDEWATAKKLKQTQEKLSKAGEQVEDLKIAKVEAFHDGFSEGFNEGFVAGSTSNEEDLKDLTDQLANSGKCAEAQEQTLEEQEVQIADREHKEEPNQRQLDSSTAQPIEAIAFHNFERSQPDREDGKSTDTEAYNKNAAEDSVDRDSETRDKLKEVERQLAERDSEIKGLQNKVDTLEAALAKCQCGQSGNIDKTPHGPYDRRGGNGDATGNNDSDDEDSDNDHGPGSGGAGTVVSKPSTAGAGKSNAGSSGTADSSTTTSNTFEHSFTGPSANAAPDSQNTIEPKNSATKANVSGAPSNEPRRTHINATFPSSAWLPPPSVIPSPDPASPTSGKDAPLEIAPVSASGTGSNGFGVSSASHVRNIESNTPSKGVQGSAAGNDSSTGQAGRIDSSSSICARGFFAGSSTNEPITNVLKVLKHGSGKSYVVEPVIKKKDHSESTISMAKITCPSNPPRAMVRFTAPVSGIVTPRNPLSNLRQDSQVVNPSALSFPTIRTTGSTPVGTSISSTVPVSENSSVSTHVANPDFPQPHGLSQTAAPDSSLVYTSGSALITAPNLNPNGLPVRLPSSANISGANSSPAPVPEPRQLPSLKIATTQVPMPVSTKVSARQASPVLKHASAPITEPVVALNPALASYSTPTLLQDPSTSAPQLPPQPTIPATNGSPSQEVTPSPPKKITASQRAFKTTKHRWADSKEAATNAIERNVEIALERTPRKTPSILAPSPQPTTEPYVSTTLSTHWPTTFPTPQDPPAPAVTPPNAHDTEMNDGITSWNDGWNSFIKRLSDADWDDDGDDDGNYGDEHDGGDDDEPMPLVPSSTTSSSSWSSLSRSVTPEDIDSLGSSLSSLSIHHTDMDGDGDALMPEPIVETGNEVDDQGDALMPELVVEKGNETDGNGDAPISEPNAEEGNEMDGVKLLGPQPEVFVGEPQENADMADAHQQPPPANSAAFPPQNGKNGAVPRSILPPCLFQPHNEEMPDIPNGSQENHGSEPMVQDNDQGEVQREDNEKRPDRATMLAQVEAGKNSRGLKFTMVYNGTLAQKKQERQNRKIAEDEAREKEARENEAREEMRRHREAERRRNRVEERSRKAKGKGTLPQRGKGKAPPTASTTATTAPPSTASTPSSVPPPPNPPPPPRAPPAPAPKPPPSASSSAPAAPEKPKANCESDCEYECDENGYPIQDGFSFKLKQKK
ncbi:MAG: hypothetical protein Q9218_005999 [Villophora microphyllina]